MTYRPITDHWLLARCKYRGGVKRYGGYPGGFLERARVLLGAAIDDPVLHVCGGLVRQYPYRGGFGPHDATLDLDEACEPDFPQDAAGGELPRTWTVRGYPQPWRAILADPPYTADDADNYPPGAAVFPGARTLLARMLDAVVPGRRVGMLHYVAPRPPAGTRYVAEIGVTVGFSNRIRVFSVYERTT